MEGQTVQLTSRVVCVCAVCIHPANVLIADST